MENNWKRHNALELLGLYNQKHDAHPALKDGVWGSARALDARGATDALKGAVSIGPRHETGSDILGPLYIVSSPYLTSKSLDNVELSFNEYSSARERIHPLIRPYLERILQ